MGKAPVVVTPQTLSILAIIFVATTVQSTFGFGVALVSMPLLAFVVPIQTAAPLVALLALTIGAMVVAQDWRKIHFRSAMWLIGASLCGIPFGLFLLIEGNAHLVKAVLAIVIIGFALYCLFKGSALVLRKDHPGLLLGFGFCAGILGGAYNINGPPLVVYGSLRRWSPAHFRATLQGFFLPSNVFILCGFWLAGLGTPQVMHLYLIVLPALVAAVVLGRVLNRLMDGQSFVRYVHIGLLAVGLALLATAMRG